MDARVLLTGTTGYIGGRLLRRFEQRGRSVRCLVRQPARLGPTHSTTDVVQGDCLDEGTLDRALTESVTSRQTATFDPRGLLGRAYWYAIFPLHAVMFRGLLARIARPALDAAASQPSDVFTYRSLVTGQAADVFRWHERPEALLDLLPSRRVRIERRTGGLRDGGRVAFSIGIGPLRMRWEARHYGYIVGERFCDEQIRGPFRIWRHTHRFVAVGTEQTLYEDRVEYAVRGGRLVARLADPVVRHLLARMFARRHQIVRAAFANAHDAALRQRLVAPGITSVERLRMVR